MAPEKVDELVRTLGLADEEATKMVSRSDAARHGTPPSGNGTVAIGNKAVGTTKEEL